jgi:hypothetical protein
MMRDASTWLVRSAFCALYGAAIAGAAATQSVSVNDEFAPVFNSTVCAVELDAAGRLLFGGDVSQVNTGEP